MLFKAFICLFLPFFALQAEELNPQLEMLVGQEALNMGRSLLKPGSKGLTLFSQVVFVSKNDPAYASSGHPVRYWRSSAPELARVVIPIEKEFLAAFALDLEEIYGKDAFMEPEQKARRLAVMLGPRVAAALEELEEKPSLSLAAAYAQLNFAIFDQPGFILLPSEYEYAKDFLKKKHEKLNLAEWLIFTKRAAAKGNLMELEASLPAIAPLQDFSKRMAKQGIQAYIEAETARIISIDIVSQESLDRSFGSIERILKRSDTGWDLRVIKKEMIGRIVEGLTDKALSDPDKKTAADMAINMSLQLSVAQDLSKKYDVEFPAEKVQKKVGELYSRMSDDLAAKVAKVKRPYPVWSEDSLYDDFHKLKEYQHLFSGFLKNGNAEASSDKLAGILLDAALEDARRSKNLNDQYVKNYGKDEKFLKESVKWGRSACNQAAYVEKYLPLSYEKTSSKIAEIRRLAW